MSNEWTELEIQILKDNYINYTDSQLINMLPNRTLTAIKTKRKDLKLLKPKTHSKYTYIDFENIMLQKGYKILSDKSEYSNAGSVMRYICPKHKNKGIQETTLGRLLEGKGCMYCGRECTIESRTKPITQEMIDIAQKVCLNHNWDFQELTRDINNKGRSKIYVYFICNEHKNYGIQKIEWNNLKRNQKCKYCQHKFLSKNDMLDMVHNGSPYIKILSDFSKLNDYVDCVCEKHNYFNKKKVISIINGQGCYYCGLEKLAEKQTLTINEIDKRIKELNPNAIRISDYIGIQKSMVYKCNKCGWKWEGLIEVSRHCPNCEKSYSFGEQIILDYLNRNKIPFEPQKRFCDCKNQRALPFDFYIPDYNICIEYQGKQHYFPLEYFGGKSTFEVRQNNDNIKRKYCKDNNIKLLEIPYTYDTKNKIENYLEIHLNN